MTIGNQMLTWSFAEARETRKRELKLRIKTLHLRENELQFSYKQLGLEILLFTKSFEK